MGQSPDSDPKPLSNPEVVFIVKINKNYNHVKGPNTISIAVIF